MQNLKTPLKAVQKDIFRQRVSNSWDTLYIIYKKIIIYYCYSYYKIWTPRLVIWNLGLFLGLQKKKIVFSFRSIKISLTFFFFWGVTLPYFCFTFLNYPDHIFSFPNYLSSKSKETFTANSFYFSPYNV